MYLSRSFVLSSRCQDFPDVKIERATRNESGDNTKVEVREQHAPRSSRRETETGRKGSKRNETVSLSSPRSYIIPLFIANIQQRQGNETRRTKLWLSLINLRSIRASDRFDEGNRISENLLRRPDVTTRTNKIRIKYFPSLQKLIRNIPTWTTT